MYVYKYDARSTEQVLKKTTLKKCKNHKKKKDYYPSKQRHPKKSKFYNSIRYISSKASHCTVFKYIES